MNLLKGLKVWKNTIQVLNKKSKTETNIPLYLPTSLFLYLSVCLFIHLIYSRYLSDSILDFIHSSVNISINIFIYLATNLHMYAHVCMCLLCMYACMHVYIYLSIDIYLFIHISLSYVKSHQTENKRPFLYKPF